MLYEKLHEHRQIAATLRAEVNRLIQSQFAPLRLELEHRMTLDLHRLQGVRHVYPHNTGFCFAEPPTGLMLLDLLEVRLVLLKRALIGQAVDPSCTSDRAYAIYDGDLQELCGTSDVNETDVAQLVASCAAEYLTAFQLDMVTFQASRSMLDDLFHISAHMPVFP